MYDVQGRGPGHGRVVADAGRHVAGRLVVLLVVLVVAARVPPVHAPIAQPRPRQQASRFLRTETTVRKRPACRPVYTHGPVTNVEQRGIDTDRMWCVRERQGPTIDFCDR